MRLFTVLILAGIMVSALAADAVAQSWADKMFETKDHNFGTVARGAEAVYRFKVTNVFKQDMHLAGVRSSCGCTTPSIENEHLVTGEVGYVVAKFNTRTFTGVHSATLSVELQWNDDGVTRTKEVQLHVHGNIRGDIVFQPGGVQFDAVDEGATQEQKVRVTYAGRSDWKIVDVRSASPDLEVEMTELPRRGGNASYDFLVRLKGTAPAGYFKEQLILVSNDSRNPRIPLDVEARIVSDLTVSPQPLVLGTVPTGQQVSKKVLVRGKKPFRIVSVECEDQCFTFRTDEESRSPRHVVEVVFEAKEGDKRKVEQAVQVATDLEGQRQTMFTVYANVVPADDEESESPSSTMNGEENERGALAVSQSDE